MAKGIEKSAEYASRKGCQTAKGWLIPMDGKSLNPQKIFPQLKTNTALQMENVKIEFKVI